MGVRCQRRAHPRRGGGRLKLTIIAYGRAGQSHEAALTERYLKRIAWPVQLVELGENAPLPAAMAGVPEWLLDEHGPALASMALARMLERARDAGTRELRFLIGPADGHGADARARATGSLSFGPATWPHLLVRAMLAEQLYRAVSILAGHPYHRA